MKLDMSSELLLIDLLYVEFGSLEILTNLTDHVFESDPFVFFCDISQMPRELLPIVKPSDWPTKHTLAVELVFKF
jgi:hypothetical protein